MNRQELIDLVSTGTMEEDNRNLSIKVAVDSAKALFAVIELHKPCCDNLNQFHTGYCLFCTETKLTKYPCPTIQAIEKALV